MSSYYTNHIQVTLAQAFACLGLPSSGEIFNCACHSLSVGCDVEAIAKVAAFRETQLPFLKAALAKEHFHSSHPRWHQAVRRFRLGEKITEIVQDIVSFEARARADWQDTVLHPWMNRHNLTLVQAISLLNDYDDSDPENPKIPLITLKDVAHRFQGQTQTFVNHLVRAMPPEERKDLPKFYQSLIT